MRIAPGNGGTAAVGGARRPRHPRPEAVARHAARERYGLVVIGPEAPLAAGLADELAAARIPDLRADARGRAPGVEQGVREGADARGPASRPRIGARLQRPRRGARPRSRRATGRPSSRPTGWPPARASSCPRRSRRRRPRVRELFDRRRAGRARRPRGAPRPGTEVSAFALVSDEAVVPLAAACDYKRLGDGDTGPEHRRDGRLRAGAVVRQRRDRAGRWPRSSSRSPGGWRAMGSRTAASCTPA